MNDNTVVLGVCPSIAESIIRREKKLHTRNVLQFFFKNIDKIPLSSVLVINRHYDHVIFPQYFSHLAQDVT